ncbi:MAG: hypothetical protein EBT57_06245 [Verrucomicrobia bacterium]|nr:hypothetical protein [Verrucomicrobiota bacterium]
MMGIRNLSFFLIPCLFFVSPAMAQETGSSKEKEKFFGKTEDLNIELCKVYGSVGDGSTVREDIPTDLNAGQGAMWLRIDVPFETKKEITSEIKFKFYLEGYEVTKSENESEKASSKKEEKCVILTGEAMYRDVPEGKKHYAGVFLPPPSIVRFSGLKPTGKTDWVTGSLNLRVEATEDGTPISEVFDLMIRKNKTKGPSGRGGTSDPEWYRSEAREIVGALLPVQDTPFWPKDYKHYPQPKKN